MQVPNFDRELPSFDQVIIRLVQSRNRRDLGSRNVAKRMEEETVTDDGEAVDCKSSKRNIKCPCNEHADLSLSSLLARNGH